MPNFDRTGPLGQGPMTGRGRGVGGIGKGTRRGVGREQGRGLRRGVGGSKECTCPKCGHVALHTRGIPCTGNKCPKCQTPMRGAYCL